MHTGGALALGKQNVITAGISEWSGLLAASCSATSTCNTGINAISGIDNVQYYYGHSWKSGHKGIGFHFAPKIGLVDRYKINPRQGRKLETQRKWGRGREIV